MTHPFLVAVQFLTRIPVTSPEDTLPANIQARSLLYYPLVGLLLGVTTIGLAYSLSGILTDSLNAIFILGLIIALTGALHLDGLADSADAWLGGHGDRQRCLDIMQDPRCGTAGVTILIVVLLAKFSAYESIIAQGYWSALLIAPLLARTAVIALFLSTPYVRKGGIGENLKQHIPETAAYWVLTISILFVVVFFAGFWICVGTALVFYLLRRQMLHSLGGTTGDTSGAMVEIVELSVLILSVAF